MTWPALVADVKATPMPALLAAVALTALNYAALTGCDMLALASVGRRLPRSWVALTSFMAYAISNSIGFAALSGVTVRYRFYSRWGIPPSELARIVFAYSATFWLGLLGLAGLSLVLAPPIGVLGPQTGGLLVGIGWLLLAVPAAYLLLAARQRPIGFRRIACVLPSTRLAAAQVAISVCEWSIAASVLYVLLPPGHVAFVAFVGAFLIATLVGMASHLPGGVGVFDGLMVALLAPDLTSAEVIPALIVYRAVYYLIPLAVAGGLLAGDEMRRRRLPTSKIGAALGQLAQQIAPSLLATLTFAAGVVLLLSGATPAAAGRLALLHRVLPLGIIEASHLLGSIVGVVLLLLSQGLARRLDSAYYLAVVAVAVGMAASLFKGFDYEEAALLFGVLVFLQRARPAFSRKGALLETRFSPGWLAAVCVALAASVWLGLFAFQHVNYSRALWWQFELESDASRFLRASVGAAVALLVFACARLFGFAPHEAPAPSERDLDDAAKIIRGQTATAPLLVYLRDKALLFDAAREAFIMYAVQGRTWVALGDPVGPVERHGELIRLFLEQCEAAGGVPVFYQVNRTHLHRYADFGLTLIKLGEEAQVDLTTFSLDGAKGARYRQAIRRLERDGGSFHIVPPAGVPALLADLRGVSDDWLAAKSRAEKGFSLGFFDESYLARFPMAIVTIGGRVVAFADLWTGAARVELSVDLMRYRRDAPANVMEALLAHVMAWGAEQGYRRFTLGMAPLSGFEASPVATLWSRLGGFVYTHGEGVYNFQGLRAYKQKFNPVWEPKYLAYPGGLRLPRVLADVSALIAGGYWRIVAPRKEHASPRPVANATSVGSFVC